MASIGHLAIGMAAARWRAQHDRAPAPRQAGALVASMLLWSGLSMLPDADVLVRGDELPMR